MTPPDTTIASQQINETILLIRGNKALLDRDLAHLYGVATFNPNKAVKRNLYRFPADFMFEFAPAEVEDLRFHLGISSSAHGGCRYLPYAFTEQGVAMLSAVLRSPRAVQASPAAQASQALAPREIILPALLLNSPMESSP